MVGVLFATMAGVVAPSTNSAAGAASSSRAPAYSIDQLIADLAKSATQKAAGEAAGWAIDTIIRGGSDTDKIRRQLDEIQAQLVTINQKVDALSQQVSQLQAALWNKTDQDSYNGLAGQLSTDFSDLDRYYTYLYGTDGHPGFVLTKGIGDQLNGNDVDMLREMRTRSITIIRDILGKMIPKDQRADGLLKIFDSVTFRLQKFYNADFSVPDRYYTSDYVDPVLNQVDFYKGELAEALDVAAEAWHISFKSGSQDYPADGSQVAQAADVVLAQTRLWVTRATHGVGRLPEGVLVDDKTSTMWSRSNVTLSGQAHAPYYCYSNDPKYSCLLFSAPAQPESYPNGWTKLLEPSRPLADLVKAVHLAGFSDWRIPRNYEELTPVVCTPAPAGTPYRCLDPVSWSAAQGMRIPLDFPQSLPTGAFSAPILLSSYFNGSEHVPGAVSYYRNLRGQLRVLAKECGADHAWGPCFQPAGLVLLVRPYQKPLVQP